MAERAKITEFWICVSDDGSGPGEGVLTRVRAIGRAPDQRKGFPRSRARNKRIGPALAQFA